MEREGYIPLFDLDQKSFATRQASVRLMLAFAGPASGAYRGGMSSTQEIDAEFEQADLAQKMRKR